jgi:biopolymer transport protein ExbD
MSGEPIKRQARPKSGRRSRKKRRIPARTDMTAMVDIVMLLLIFYMVTTVFMMPQAMEINVPEVSPDPPIVRWSRLLTLRIDADNRFFWNVGDPAENLPKLIPSVPGKDGPGQYKVDSDALRWVLRDVNRRIDNLNTLIKIHPAARYNAMVDVLDEIDYMERDWNMQTAAELGKAPEDLTEDEHFSYRYAIDDWVGTDDRIAAEALAAGKGGE